MPSTSFFSMWNLLIVVRIVPHSTSCQNPFPSSSGAARVDLRIRNHTNVSWKVNMVICVMPERNNKKR